MNTVVIVSRHKATVRYLIEAGIAPADAHVIEHATPDDVRGKHVVGNVPLDLAALADRITTVPLPRPRRDAAGRMEELNLAAIRAGAGEPKTYIVRVVDPTEE